jgi:DNA-binding transcriptional LysR family regulator
MDLKQIRYFLNLADTLNFTRAAQLSDVSQPALTKAIQRLEDELGGRLIYRDGKDTRLTELGRTLRGEFETIISTEMRARELADLVTREKRTRISIGIANTMGPNPVWPFLETFLSDMPDVEAVIQSVRPQMAEEMVLSGAIDACFYNSVNLANPKLQAIPLYRERLMLAAGRDHEFSALDAVPMKALRSEMYIDRIKCEFREAVIEHFMDQDVLARPVIQSDREDWVQNAIARGFGISMLPEHSVVVDGIKLTPVSGLSLSREVGLLTVFGSATAPAIQRLRARAGDYDWPASKV